MQVEMEDKRPLRLEEEIDPKSSPERDQEEDPEYEPMSSPVTSDIGSDDHGMQETRLGFFYKSNKPFSTCIFKWQDYGINISVSWTKLFK